MKWTTSREYMAATAYDMQFHGSIRYNDKTVVWSAKASLRAKCFAWLLIHGKILKADSPVR